MRRLRDGLLDARVPVHAGDLFDEVDLDRAVGPPRRDRHVHDLGGRAGLDLEPDRPQEARDVVDGEIRAEQRVHPSKAQRHRRARRQITPRVDLAVELRVGTRRAGAARRSDALARSATSGSAPRSKRADASDRSASRPAVAAIVGGSNHAISSATAVVLSSISVEAPPITPAMPIGTSLPSQISTSADGERALDVVEGHDRLAVTGLADAEAAARAAWRGRRCGSAGRARASRSSRRRRRC